MSDISITIVEKEGMTLHCVTSPAEGEMVNSQIIETENALIIIDTPLLKPYGDAFKEYVDSLNKKVERVITTHAHPDHWFCLGYFQDVPKYAFQETIDQITGMKDMVVGFHNSIHADMMPKNIIIPDMAMSEGMMEIDGLKMMVHKFAYVEDNTLMVIELPDQNMLLAQDLVYNMTHMYIATKNPDGSYAVDNWIKTLKMFVNKNIETIVPGHGEITDSSVFAGCMEYLSFALDSIQSAKDGDEYIKMVMDKYPDHRIPLMLEMTKVMCFPEVPAN